MPRRHLITICFALASLAAVASCERRGTVEPSGQGTIVVRADLSGTLVATVVVEVTAPDIPTPLVFNIPITNGVASGAITVPAGSNRTVTIRAFDAGGVETHSGSVTLDIQSGTGPTISIVLTPLTGDVPITVTLGSFTVTVTPSTTSLHVGGTVQLSASIQDWNGSPLTGTVAWATLDPGVASVDDAGLVTASRAGATTITATFQGAAGAVAITVSP